MFLFMAAKGISYGLDLFDKDGNILAYNKLLETYPFLVHPRELNSICKAVLSGIIQ